ncbi:MAG: hypothetical protein HY002_19225 [Candidatus Rokubacteria bacterium]|nr:hypothetical protein [Candidatus Rokubacteria bacterium]
MSAGNPTQELFDLWRKSLEEGTQAWLRAMGQAGAPPPTPPPFDFTQFWRPLLTQGMEIWQKAATQGKVSPEFMQQWKGFMDQWIETWSQVLGRVMATEEFAQTLGRYLDQWLSAQAPLRKGLEQYNEMALRTLGLPARGQVVSLASQLVGLEERVERLEDRLDELKGLLKDTLRAVMDHEEAARRRAAPLREGA